MVATSEYRLSRRRHTFDEPSSMLHELLLYNGDIVEENSHIALAHPRCPA